MYKDGYVYAEHSWGVTVHYKDENGTAQSEEWYYNEFDSVGELWRTLRMCGIKEEEES